MGGSQSHEFMVASDAGEDFVAVCPACGYSANLEKAVATPAAARRWPIPRAISRPRNSTRRAARPSPKWPQFTGLPETSQMKSLVLVADGKPVLVLLRGDHQLSETKFGARRQRSGIPPGAPRRDPGVVRRRRRLAGAGGRQEHAHPRGPGAGGPPQHDRRRQPRRLPPAPRHPGRGFPGRDPRPAPGGRGRPVPHCGAAARDRKTVEIGHIFKLGYKYSDSMGLRVLNADGKEVTPIMGSYGIGIERILTCGHRAVSRQGRHDSAACHRAVPGGGDARQQLRRRADGRRARRSTKAASRWAWTPCSTTATSAPA